MNYVPNDMTFPVNRCERTSATMAVLKGRDATVPCNLDYDFTKLEELVARSIAKPVDVHREAAAKLFGVPYDEVTPEQRITSKNANYLKWWTK